MTKKSSASSRPGKLVSRKAEDIFNKPLTKKQSAMLRKLEDIPDSEIDCSDIPELTDEQVTEFQRRPAKRLTAVRLDADVYEWLQSFGGEYTSRINEILRSVMKHQRVAK
jgi:uncharacterized protein (DUF4415 family)